MRYEYRVVSWNQTKINKLALEGFKVVLSKSGSNYDDYSRILMERAIPDASTVVENPDERI